MAEAGERSPLLKPLLERCLSLHAEDRPAADEALRSLESLRADPCAYHPAGHGAGILADRWFQVRVIWRREKNASILFSKNKTTFSMLFCKSVAVDLLRDEKHFSLLLISG